MFEEPSRRKALSLTPLIDVVFLLLIFFMLTSSFLQTQALSVVTPSPSQEDMPEDVDVVEVWLLGDGSLAVDGNPVQPGDLTPRISEAIDDREDITVSILAEPGARTQALISAIEAARDAGAASVGTARVEELQ